MTTREQTKLDHTTLEQTTPTPAPPSHAQLLADLFELNFRIEDLISKHSLSPAQFLAFTKDEAVRETLDAFEACQEREQRIVARQNQAGAVGFLHQCIMDAPSTIEIRRAATAMARLTTIMLAPPRRSKPAKAAVATPTTNPVAPTLASSDDPRPAPSSEPLTTPLPTPPTAPPIKLATEPKPLKRKIPLATSA